MRLVIALLVSMSALAQSPQSLLQLADPNAQALLGVEWSRIARSQYVTDIKTRFATELAQAKGLEFLEDLDRLVLTAAPGKNGAPTSVLVLIEGRFKAGDLKKMAAQQKATVQRFRGIEIYHPPSKEAGDMDLAILSAQMLLAGDPASVRAAIERMQTGATQPSTDIYRRAAALAARSDIWGVASPEIFSAMGLKEMGGQLKLAAGNDPMAAEFLKALKTIESGAPVEFGVRIDDLPNNAPQLALSPRVTIKAQPKPTGPQKVKIYGLDEGVKEFEIK